MHSTIRVRSTKNHLCTWLRVHNWITKLGNNAINVKYFLGKSNVKLFDSGFSVYMQKYPFCHSENSETCEYDMHKRMSNNKAISAVMPCYVKYYKRNCDYDKLDIYDYFYNDFDREQQKKQPNRQSIQNLWGYSLFSIRSRLAVFCSHQKFMRIIENRVFHVCSGWASNFLYFLSRWVCVYANQLLQIGIIVFFYIIQFFIVWSVGVCFNVIYVLHNDS